MNRSTQIIVAVNTAFTTFVAVWLCQGGHSMETYIVGLLTAVIAGLSTFAAARYTAKKSQLNKNTEALEKLTEEFMRGIDKISESIGKTPDDKTLTSQHKDLHNLLEREIDTTERRYTESEKRISNFTVEQHNMAKVVAEFQQFLDSWERLAAEVNELNYQNAQLRNQVEMLLQDKRNLENEVQRLQKYAPTHPAASSATPVQDDDWEMD